MNIKRRKTKSLKVGNIGIGGNFPVSIQSMAKTKTSNVEAVIAQIERLKACGCEIVRLAMKDADDTAAIKKIKSHTDIALVADIHFNWRLAIEAIENGIDKIRLNPGNIYKKDEIAKIARAAKMQRIPIRVGVNSGSLRTVASSQSQVNKMLKSALSYIKILEGFHFYDIVVSLKASNIFDTIEAYRKMSKLCDYPFHLGVTATGLPAQGLLKSAIAIGSLLLEGVGDTIRISLTDKPEEEVLAAKRVLEAVGLRRFGPEIISCPTCGRCEVDLITVVKQLENKLSNIEYRISTQPAKLAVMGCVVNGPGEAKDADIGIAFGKKDGLLFKRGKPVKKVAFNKSVDVLLKQIKR